MEIKTRNRYDDDDDDLATEKKHDHLPSEFREGIREPQNTGTNHSTDIVES